MAKKGWFSKRDEDEIETDRRRSKAAKEQARAQREQAKTDRYRAQTKIREQNGGAGVQIRFYDIVLSDGERVRVPRKMKDESCRSRKSGGRKDGGKKQ